ncbi:hypothetical protein CDD80_1715 [Ophiocordyceps camponoti-rufipedis]|uniref:Apple domain-containing protein n=1 Tax=Ophiocordyceps camponoti-rufipedis TaxID=2004952 RepID=A0A2C5XLJ3_9HYPO|nr:hypothetical protein CDD80_1715 [Ophiocordyceps camponoti-rufipedis]
MKTGVAVLLLAVGVVAGGEVKTAVNSGGYPSNAQMKEMGEATERMASMEVKEAKGTVGAGKGPGPTTLADGRVCVPTSSAAGDGGSARAASATEQTTGQPSPSSKEPSPSSKEPSPKADKQRSQDGPTRDAAPQQQQPASKADNFTCPNEDKSCEEFCDNFPGKGFGRGGTAKCRFQRWNREKDVQCVPKDGGKTQYFKCKEAPKEKKWFDPARGEKAG